MQDKKAAIPRAASIQPTSIIAKLRSNSKVTASRGQNEAEIEELKRQQEANSAALRSKMQAELDKVAAELLKIQNEKNQAASLKAKKVMMNVAAGKADKAELQQFRDQLESSQQAVSKVIDEEKGIQAAIMEKKLKARQQRLLNSQKAASVQNTREEIIARLDFEKAQLDRIEDVNELVEALARVNDLKAKLVELNSKLTN